MRTQQIETVKGTYTNSLSFL